MGSFRRRLQPLFLRVTVSIQFVCQPFGDHPDFFLDVFAFFKVAGGLFSLDFQLLLDQRSRQSWSLHRSRSSQTGASSLRFEKAIREFLNPFVVIQFIVFTPSQMVIFLQFPVKSIPSCHHHGMYSRTKQDFRALSPPPSKTEQKLIGQNSARHC